MFYKKKLIILYLINFSLLITHEIDSAYWHEWQLFHLPGGIDLFLILNFILIFVFLFGFEKVVKGDRAGLIFSYFLAIGGLFAFIIHGVFILRGYHEFKTIVSLTILSSIFFVSLIQIIYLSLLRDHKFVVKQKSDDKAR